MTFLSSLAVNFGRVATYIQLLIYLPLSLDLVGTECFLALSAGLASYYFMLSTIRVVTRGTRWAWVGQFLAIFQFIVVPACLLVCFNVYSPPSSSYFSRKGPLEAASGSTLGSSFFGSKARPQQQLGSMSDSQIWLAPFEQILAESGPLQAILAYAAWLFFWLARRVPGWWSTLLRSSSPLFSLLEGIATLLVIQSIGSISRWMIASSLSRPPTRRRLLLRYLPSFGLGGAEVYQLLFLLLSAAVYVSSAVALYVSFDGATKASPGTAAAVGASVASTLWLTAIAFAVRKGNVVETSLMLAYVVFNVCALDSLTFTADPLTLIRSFKAGSSAPPLPPLPEWRFLAATINLVSQILGQSFDFIGAAVSALPKSVIVSLVYRLMVLYAASRILPLLKNDGSPASRWREVEVYDRDAEVSEEDEEDSESEWSASASGTETEGSEGKGSGPGEKQRRGSKGKVDEDGKSLREEEPFGAFISIIVSYSRLILIAVYSHLLLLDQSHQVYWRFLTVGITLAVWTSELVLAGEDTGEAIVHGWK